MVNRNRPPGHAVEHVFGLTKREEKPLQTAHAWYNITHGLKTTAKRKSLQQTQGAPLFFSSRGGRLLADLPGGPVGTENLTGVLVATMRDPSKRGPGARLISGLKSQGDDGVGGQAHPIFTHERRPRRGPHD